jgi:Kef-type K+ transport system membrane component KefB
MKLEEQFLSIFIIILVFSKILAGLSKLIKQPKVVGELIAGVILGPTVMNIMYLLNIEDNVQDSIRIFSQIGVIIIIFYAAFTIEDSGKNVIRTGIIVGIIGVIIPFVSIMGICIAFNLSYNESIYIGLTMSATSIAISIQTLKELGEIDDNSELIIIATIDDITIIMCLSVFTAITSSKISDIGITIGRMIGFFIVFGGGVWFLKNKLSKILKWVFKDNEDINIILISIIFGYSLIAEIGGKVSMITGSFLFGIIMKHTDLIIDDMSNSFFITIFFATIGIFLNLRELTLDVAVFTIVLLVICIITKIISSFFGGLICKNNWKKSLRLGIGMIGRGEVGLILATQGIQAEIITEKYYSVLVLTIIISTILTPLFLRLSYTI